MLVPNKVISISESCIYRSALLLQKINGEVSVDGLYQVEKKLFFDMSDFIDALSLLFVLGKIVLDEENGVVKHA
jgi:hypothetical protein